ncbi:MAG: hypothetical protein LBD11_08380 [Candidatus Peribacteria bacterium]|jgi:hypothetical protein|nr:hypothetical protein [Candidatus Peribacteria bacterium]
MMDYNGDGVYNRVPLAPNNSERSFTTNPIVASELGTNAVTTEKIVNNAVTDDKIGTRAITDVAASYTLVSIAAKTLTNWLTGIYANLKYILQNMQTKIIEAPVMLTFATSLSIDMSQSLNYILNISDNTTLSFNNITP